MGLLGEEWPIERALIWKPFGVWRRSRKRREDKKDGIGRVKREWYKKCQQVGSVAVGYIAGGVAKVEEMCIFVHASFAET